MKEVTAEERREFVSFWTDQRAAIEGRVSDKTMQWFSCYTTNDGVGYEMGQLRPGKLGQWDLYYWLVDPEIRCDENEALIASGLTAAEVADAQRRQHYEDNGVDPDDPNDVRQFERIQRMNPDEANAEIARLELLLAASG